MRIKGEIKYISRTLFIRSRWPLPVPSSVRILSGLLVSLKHVKWNKTACAKNFSPQIQTLRFTEYLYYNNTSIIYFFKCTVYCTLTIFMCHMQMCVVWLLKTGMEKKIIWVHNRGDFINAFVELSLCKWGPSPTFFHSAVNVISGLIDNNMFGAPYLCFIQNENKIRDEQNRCQFSDIPDF